MSLPRVMLGGMNSRSLLATSMVPLAARTALPARRDGNESPTAFDIDRIADGGSRWNRSLLAIRIEVGAIHVAFASGSRQEPSGPPSPLGPVSCARKKACYRGRSGSKFLQRSALLRSVSGVEGDGAQGSDADSYPYRQPGDQRLAIPRSPVQDGERDAGANGGVGT